MNYLGEPDNHKAGTLYRPYEPPTDLWIMKEKKNMPLFHMEEFMKEIEDQLMWGVKEEKIEEERNRISELFEEKVKQLNQ